MSTASTCQCAANPLGVRACMQPRRAPLAPPHLFVVNDLRRVGQARGLRGLKQYFPAATAGRQRDQGVSGQEAMLKQSSEGCPAPLWHPDSVRHAS